MGASSISSYRADVLNSSQEDELLRKLVQQYGPQKWSVVAEKIRGRSGKSCRLRCVRLLQELVASMVKLC